MKSYLLLSIEHKKPIPELTDLVAGRIYMMDGVEKNGECTARLLTPAEVILLDDQRDMDDFPALLKRQTA